jgi:hypothetical protein
MGPLIRLRHEQRISSPFDSLVSPTLQATIQQPARTSGQSGKHQPCLISSLSHLRICGKRKWHDYSQYRMNRTVLSLIKSLAAHAKKLRNAKRCKEKFAKSFRSSSDGLPRLIVQGSSSVMTSLQDVHRVDCGEFFCQPNIIDKALVLTPF